MDQPDLTLPFFCKSILDQHIWWGSSQFWNHRWHCHVALLIWMATKNWRCSEFLIWREPRSSVVPNMRPGQKRVANMPAAGGQKTRKWWISFRHSGFEFWSKSVASSSWKLGENYKEWTVRGLWVPENSVVTQVLQFGVSPVFFKIQNTNSSKQNIKAGASAPSSSSSSPPYHLLD